MSNSIVNPDIMLQRWHRVFCSGVLLYPIVMHVMIVYDLLGAALLGLAAISMVAAVFALLNPRGRMQALPYLFIAAAVGAGFLSGNQFAVYLPSIVFNVFFASAFAYTLRTGDTPMIERFMRAHHGEQMGPELVRYARQLTYAWVMVCAVLALTSAVLAIFASLEIWSLFANVVSYAVVAALFIGQFIYGYFRHRAIAAMQIVPMAARVARRMTAGTPGRP